MINKGAMVEKSCKAEDGSFEGVISMRCSGTEDTGARKSLRKKSSKKQKSSSSGRDV